MRVKLKKLFYGLIPLPYYIIREYDIQGETTTLPNDRNAEEVLTLDSDADIFQYDGVIYKTNIDWVEELSLTKDVQIGEIIAKNDANTDFKDEMSNKLPVGAKIFSTKERGDNSTVESEERIQSILQLLKDKQHVLVQLTGAIVQ